MINVGSNVRHPDAPEFSDKPHIAQRDGGQVIVIKCRGKSSLEITCQWLKVGGVHLCTH